MTSGGDIMENFFFLILCLTFSKLSTVSKQELTLWNNVLVSNSFFPKLGNTVLDSHVALRMTLQKIQF